MNRFSFLLLIISLLWISCKDTKPAKTPPKSVNIAFLGHSQQTHHSPGVFEALVDSIIQREPDYVFVLGDVFWVNTDSEWEKIKKELDRIEVPKYYCPGNHDLTFTKEIEAGYDSSSWKARQMYLKRFGYRYTQFSDDFANYVFIDSGDSLAHVIEFLEEAKTRLEAGKPNLLMLHHDLLINRWNDGNPLNLAWKGFPYDSIKAHLEPYDYLFFGDAGLNFQITREDDRQFVRCGIRAVGDPVFFTMVEINAHRQVDFEPVYVLLPEDHPWRQGRLE